MDSNVDVKAMDDGNNNSNIVSIQEKIVEKDAENKFFDDNSKKFKICKFGSFDQAKKCIEDYQQKTLSYFIKLNKDTNFGNEDFVPNVGKGRIHYWSQEGKNGIPIGYDGVPFMHVGQLSLVCHKGIDLNLRKIQLYQAERYNDPRNKYKLKCRKQQSKSTVGRGINCPAKIYVLQIVKFPGFKVPENAFLKECVPTNHMRKITKKRIIRTFQMKPRRVVRESCYYVSLPSPLSHQGHSLSEHALKDCMRRDLNKKAMSSIHRTLLEMSDKVCLIDNPSIPKEVNDALEELDKSVRECIANQCGDGLKFKCEHVKNDLKLLMPKDVVKQLPQMFPFNRRVC